MTKATGMLLWYAPAPLAAKKPVKQRPSGMKPMRGSRITSMRGEKPSQTKPTPQIGAKSAARGTLRRMNSPMTQPDTSMRPPRRLAQHAASKALSANSSAVPVKPKAGEYLKQTGSMTMKTVMNPAGVLMPYGRAVTSIRSSFCASLAAIHAYQKLPKMRAQPMPGQTFWKTMLTKAP
jgi:hypothetical protein